MYVENEKMESPGDACILKVIEEKRILVVGSPSHC